MFVFQEAKMIKIGIIGVGVLGEYHLQKCIADSATTVVGIFDADPIRCDKIHRKYNVIPYSSSNALITDADALIIATPCTSHSALVQQCIMSDRHVLVEKPLASDYSQGATIVRNAREKGLVLHVGHSEAFNPVFDALKQKNPAPQFIEIHRLAPYNIRGTDVSVVLDLMVHDLHLVLQLCKAEPIYESIAAAGVAVLSDTHDIANARLTFPDGCIANITASRISAKKMRKLRLFQKNAYFSVDMDAKTFEYYSLDPSAGAESCVQRHEEKYSTNDPLSEELESFIFEITHKKQAPATRGDEALTSLQMSDAILHTIDNNAHTIDS